MSEYLAGITIGLPKRTLVPLVFVALQLFVHASAFADWHQQQRDIMGTPDFGRALA